MGIFPMVIHLNLCFSLIKIVFIGELFQVLKMMVGSNLKDSQLQQIVDKVNIIEWLVLFYGKFYSFKIDNNQCR